MVDYWMLVMMALGSVAGLLSNHCCRQSHGKRVLAFTACSDTLVGESGKWNAELA